MPAGLERYATNSLLTVTYSKSNANNIIELCITVP